jgi:cation transport regulator ChaB
MPRKGPNGSYAPLPSTLKRSDTKARKTYEAVLEHAEGEYKGDEERAHRAAWGAVKHTHEKIGDHWVPKKHNGPSDERSAGGGPNPRGRSHGGVDVKGHTRAELLLRAKSLGLTVPSRATKDEIAEALNRENRKQTRAAREHASTRKRS